MWGSYLVNLKNKRKLFFLPRLTPDEFINEYEKILQFVYDLNKYNEMTMNLPDDASESEKMFHLIQLATFAKNILDNNSFIFETLYGIDAAFFLLCRDVESRDIAITKNDINSGKYTYAVISENDEFLSGMEDFEY